MSELHILNQPFTREDTAELVDLLRKNFLYQTPDVNDDEVRVIMIVDHWNRMLELITKHGGWDLPDEVRQALLEQEAQDGRNGDGPGDAES